MSHTTLTLAENAAKQSTMEMKISEGSSENSEVVSRISENTRRQSETFAQLSAGVKELSESIDDLSVQAEKANTMTESIQSSISESVNALEHSGKIMDSEKRFPLTRQRS